MKTQADNKRKVLSKRGKTETKVEAVEEQEAGNMEKEEELTRKLTGKYTVNSAVLIPDRTGVHLQCTESVHAEAA